MTTEQIQICTALGNVNYLPASFDKRLGNNLYSLSRNKSSVLSEKQNEWMYRLLYKYRRQLPNTYEKYKDNHFCSRLKNKKT